MSEYVDLKALEEKTAKLVELARLKGADTAMADMHQKSEFNVEVRNGEIENLSEAESYGAYLVVSKNGRRASVTSCDVTPESLDHLVDQAIALCRYTDEDPFYSLPEKSLLFQEANYENLALFDPHLLRLSVEEKIDIVRGLETLLIAQDSRLKSDGASLSTLIAGSALANSHGFVASETTGMILKSTAAFAEDVVRAGDLNRGRKQTGHWVSRARYVEDLESSEEVARMAAQQVLRKLGARKPKTGRFPVYFEPKMAQSLWNHFLKAARGSAIFRHESWLAERLETDVCSQQIKLMDNPRVHRGLRSRLFDDEGVVCKPLEVVSAGRLTNLILGTYSANKLKTRSTGRAGGPSNVFVSPGILSEQEMITAMGTGVWVTMMMGAGVNISNGDYSRGALGLWVENGEVAYPISEFTLNGNLDQMLQNITLIGNNVYSGDAIQTPGLVVGELTISGE